MGTKWELGDEECAIAITDQSHTGGRHPRGEARYAFLHSWTFFQFSATATAIHPWTVWSTPATATSPCISHGDDCATNFPSFLEALPPRLIDVVHALAYMLQWALHGLGVKSIHLAPRKMAGHTYLVYRTSAGKMHAPVPSYRSYCRFHKFFFYP